MNLCLLALKLLTINFDLNIYYKYYNIVIYIVPLGVLWLTGSFFVCASVQRSQMTQGCRLIDSIWITCNWRMRMRNTSAVLVVVVRIMSISEKMRPQEMNMFNYILTNMPSFICDCCCCCFVSFFCWLDHKCIAHPWLMLFLSPSFQYINIITWCAVWFWIANFNNNNKFSVCVCV